MTATLEALLVDHSRRTEPVLARALDEAGYQAVLKPVGGEGDLREAVRDAGWEIVFFAQPDGPLALHDLVRVLRDVGTDLPIVVLSSTPGEDAAVEALARGADDYLVLPALSRLGTAVERSLAAAASRRARAAERLALVESEKHFRRLFDLASIGLAEIDPKALRIVRANRALGRIAGCPVSELQAVPITAFFPPERVQLVRELPPRRSFREAEVRLCGDACPAADAPESGLGIQIVQPALAVVCGTVNSPSRSKSHTTPISLPKASCALSHWKVPSHGGSLTGGRGTIWSISGTLGLR